MRRTKRIVDLIGNTPLIRIRKNVCAKLESMNPSGSIKDRMALFVLETAEKNGDIKPGYEIIEATSGNTGISFSMIATLKGYRFTAFIPDSMTVERTQIMRAYGANLILTRTIEEAIEKSEGFKTTRNVWLPRQFSNKANVDCHRETTGKEIIRQLDEVDVFVAGVGTGGTLMGVAEALREKFSDVEVIAVEPAESPVLSGGKAGEHKIHGIGEGFIPSIVDLDDIDEVIQVKSIDAMEMTAELARRNGLFLGISSGANICASLKIARRNPNLNVVTILPDSGNRYLSMNLSSVQGKRRCARAIPERGERCV